MLAPILGSLLCMCELFLWKFPEIEAIIAAAVSRRVPEARRLVQEDRQVDWRIEQAGAPDHSRSTVAMSVTGPSEEVRTSGEPTWVATCLLPKPAALVAPNGHSEASMAQLSSKPGPHFQSPVPLDVPTGSSVEC